MPSRDDPPFLSNAARELRAIADRVAETVGRLDVMLGNVLQDRPQGLEVGVDIRYDGKLHVC